MAVKSAADALKRWQAAMSSGTARQNYIDGINATTVNPMAEAATPAAMQRYRENVLESITSGRRERKLMQASAAVWKSNAVSFGASKLADAAKKGGAKYQAWSQSAAGTWQQMQDAAKAATGPLEKVRAALNVQLQAAGKPTIRFTPGSAGKRSTPFPSEVIPNGRFPPDELRGDGRNQRRQR